MKITNNKLLGRGSDNWILPARQKIKEDSVPAGYESEHSSLARYIVTRGAKALSAKGASKGGYARAEALTKTQRQDIARQGAEARWQKKEEKHGTVRPQ